MISLKNLSNYGKGVIVAAVVACAVTFGVYKFSHRPVKVDTVNPPIIVEWEIDKEYGDKRTVLKNGLKLSVFKDGTDEKPSWGWSVTGTALTEAEAADKAFYMGGVK